MTLGSPHAETPPEAADLAPLASMYRAEPQRGTDGDLHAIDSVTRISMEQGAYMHELHARIRPALSVEIGLAYGFSTVFLLTAMKQGDYGHHVAIDPAQHVLWKGIGLQKVQELEMTERFTFMGEQSAAALPRLIDEKRKAQFIFIDGDHRFDGVVLDFVLADKICDQDGYVIFDDMWMPSIQKAVGFIRNNRTDYAFVKSPIPNLTVLKKVRRDTRDWQHFADF